jgi:hypothetical protein
MRFGFRRALLATFGFAVVVTSRAQQESSYDSKVRATYNFRFGPTNISTPGNADSEGHVFIPPEAFLPASYCGSCHQEAYSQWRQGLHLISNTVLSDQRQYFAAYEGHRIHPPLR